MMDIYKTISTSVNSAKLAEPIVIAETKDTRKVLFVDLNDKKRAIGETVGITIVHQRKKSNDIWEDIECIPLSSLKGGEGVKLKLDSHTTKKIFYELTKLYALIDKEGIHFGTREFTIAEADEIIKVSKDRKTIIERLLAENFGEEVWQELMNSDPDLATKLSLARVQTDRSRALNIFKDNLGNNNDDESFWQNFFRNNEWIFGYGLKYQFLSLVTDQPNYGGTDYTGKGAQRGDFLMNTEAEIKFTVLVEIKTPSTKLLSFSHGKNKEIRNDVWLLSDDLLGAVSQIQVNSMTWSLNSQKSENIRQLEKNKIYSVVPKGILIMGNNAEFKNNVSQLSCFEIFRRNINNPEIITFDELFERATYIVTNQTKEMDHEVNEVDDVPF